MNRYLILAAVCLGTVSLLGINLALCSALTLCH